MEIREHDKITERAAIFVGDCRARMRELPAGIARTCVTSPPYWGLRDYGVDGQLGLEQSPDEYVAGMVDVFREVRRLLTDDGTLWLNLGDSYASATKGSGGGKGSSGLMRDGRAESGRASADAANARSHGATRRFQLGDGLKAKDLVGIPWLVAFALRADGWYLRSEIIWHKLNPMPESVTDRPTKSHEHVFLLAKSERYYYDADAIKEPAITVGANRGAYKDNDVRENSGGARAAKPQGETRNKRDVWTVTPKPFKGAHFATMPPGLAEPCILAGSAPGDIVVDPFAGAGTTGLVALQHGRNFIGTELNPEYAALAWARIHEETT